MSAQLKEPQINTDARRCKLCHSCAANALLKRKIEPLEHKCGEQSQKVFEILALMPEENRESKGHFGVRNVLPTYGFAARL